MNLDRLQRFAAEMAKPPRIAATFDGHADSDGESIYLVASDRRPIEPESRADRIGNFLIAVLLIFTALYLGWHVVRAGDFWNQPEVSCQEDEACWDCETMGNRVCGPTKP